MDQNLRAEFDALREQVQALTTRLDGLTGVVVSTTPGAVRGGASFPREALWRETEHLARRAAERGVRGIVAFAGSYTEGGAREYRWHREKSAEDLLAQDDEAVARALAALGHRQRLALLKAILEQPATAAELIDRLSLTSTGQAYHHLNTLQAAGLIRQGERGRFEFVGHQAGAFLTLLAGVWGMLGTQYGTGTWEGTDRASEPPGVDMGRG
jgi:DNA gyrase subunit B